MICITDTLILASFTVLVRQDQGESMQIIVIFKVIHDESQKDENAKVIP